MPVLAATVYFNTKLAASASVAGTAGTAGYTDAHDAAAASFTPFGDINGQELQGSAQYAIYRNGLFFNTSTIPSDAAIISATLSVYGVADSSLTDFNLTIVNGSALSNPYNANDYGALLAATASGGILSSTAWSNTSYNEIPLNSIGLGFITKAGTTKVAIRSSRDISSTRPTGFEWIEFLSVDETNPAKLTVSYEAKGNLFVKAERLHYVSYTGIEYYIQGIAV